jgi:hypothetical protein
MPQRKPPTVPTKKPPAKASGRAGAPPAARSGAGRKPGGPPPRRPSKSIVNQRQTPWALIATVVVLVLFAGGIVAYAVTRHSGSTDTKNPYTRPEVAAAKNIQGIIWKVEPNHTHTTGLVKYNTSPPIGGNHSPYWALCNGVAYNHQIANENAVHMLEHGSVWITYNPKTIKAGDLAKLKTRVLGVDRMALSPYAGLKTPISLQAWNYQLFVNSASDPRIDKFIDALRYKPNTVTPEPQASCSGDGFVASQSYPGHPYEG